MANENPCDWDGDTYCVECSRPATHKKIFAMIAESPVYEFVCCQCAVSIEKEVRHEIERLRVAGDAMAEVLRSGSDSGWDKAIDGWEEARRG